MKIVGIAGGSGFVGRHLSALLVENGYQVIVFGRNKSARKKTENIQLAYWNPDKKEIDQQALSQVDAMVNLAGAGVADKRWTDAYKQEIISSRVDATLFLVDQLRQHAPACQTYISSSATGIYGPDRPGSSPFTEDSPAWHDFLAEVCVKWEAAAQQATAYYRTVIVRFGIVLGREAGAFRQLAVPMQLGVMPILGNGQQMVSWIHVKDVAAIILYALQRNSLRDIYNAVAPEVVSHKQLMKTIAAAKGGLKVPVPVPSFMLRLIMGESSIEVLKSCTASADKIAGAGFNFQFGSLQAAVKDLV